MEDKEFEEHNHWSKYHSRVIKKNTYEYLQLICVICGLIFHEVELRQE